MKLNKKIIVVLSILLITINMVGCNSKEFNNSKAKEAINEINQTKIGQSINEFLGIDVENSANELLNANIVKELMGSVKLPNLKDSFNKFMDSKIFE